MKIWISASINKYDCRIHKSEPKCDIKTGWGSGGYDHLSRSFLAEMLCIPVESLPKHGSHDLMDVEFKEVKIEMVRGDKP
jgi:hypothetical protein